MIIENDFFRFEYNKIKPKQGRILISEPFVEDYYFNRSVVFLTEHGKDGSLGFIINKPINVKMADLFEDFPMDIPVWIGGPVSTNTIHFLHTYGNAIPNTTEVLKGIYWGGDFEVLKHKILIEGYDPMKVRFFLGYSGWEIGQLDKELNINSWLVSNITQQDVISKNQSDAWRYFIAQLGEKYAIWANSPIALSLN